MSNLIAKINALVWDHWFYMPSIGIIVSAVSLFQSRRSRRVLLCALAAGALAFSITTVSRNPLWKDTETVSKFILRFEPYTVKTWNNLGMALADKGENEKAIECYKIAIKLGDTYPQTHHNLANIHRVLGEYDIAEAEYNVALKMDRKFYYSHIGLGRLYLAKDQIDTAVWHFKKALEIHPHLPRIREFISKVDK